MSDAVKTAAQTAFQNGYELKKKELEQLQQDNACREEKYQGVVRDLGVARQLEVQLQGEKVQLEAEVTTQRQQVSNNAFAQLTFFNQECDLE